MEAAVWTSPPTLAQLSEKDYGYQETIFTSKCKTHLITKKCLEDAIVNVIISCHTDIQFLLL